MRTIGLLHGMSQQATVEYYRLINALVNEARGGYATAELLLYSVNYENIEAFVKNEQWGASGDYLAEGARKLERAGADFLILGSNTMHQNAPQIEEAVGIPLIHVVDVTAEAVAQAGVKTIGVLGTRHTMEAEFYRRRFEEGFGIGVLTPSDRDRKIIDDVIWDELIRGMIKPASRDEYLRIMRDLIVRGAEGIVLGCTELDLLVKQEDLPGAPLFDTTALHAKKAVGLALDLDDPPAAPGTSHLDPNAPQVSHAPGGLSSEA